MTDKAAFKATYENFKYVPSRKKVQILLEAPIEHGDEIHRILGSPNPEFSVWLAVARIQDYSQNEKRTEEPKTSPFRQRAGILAKDKSFHKYIEIAFRADCERISQYAKYEGESQADKEEIAAIIIREICGVESRSDIDHSETAKEKFTDLYKNYMVWLKYESNT